MTCCPSSVESCVSTTDVRNSSLLLELSGSADTWGTNMNNLDHASKLLSLAHRSKITVIDWATDLAANVDIFLIIGTNLVDFRDFSSESCGSAVVLLEPLVDHSANSFALLS